MAFVQFPHIPESVPKAGHPSQGGAPKHVVFQEVVKQLGLDVRDGQNCKVASQVAHEWEVVPLVCASVVGDGRTGIGEGVEKGAELTIARHIVDSTSLYELWRLAYH
jgi:hypothetical protein